MHPTDDVSWILKTAAKAAAVTEEVKVVVVKVVAVKATAVTEEVKVAVATGGVKAVVAMGPFLAGMAVAADNSRHQADPRDLERPGLSPPDS